MSAASQTVRFTISGEFLTKIARNLMLEDEPGRAWRLLADGLMGDGTADVVRKVLAGEADLTGDSTIGVNVALRGAPDFDMSAADEYKKQLAYVYSGRFRYKALWYRPRAVVTAYGPEDAKHAGPCRSKRGLAAWGKRRASFYANPDEIIEVCKVSVDPALAPGDHHVIYEPCGEPPQWWRPPSTNAQQALDAWLAQRNGVEHVGADYTTTDKYGAPLVRPTWRSPTEEEVQEREAREAAEEARHEAEMQRIAERVREQAGDDVFELTLLDGRVLKVPRAPFTCWALRGLPGEVPSNLPAWETVSSSGWKMINDDPNHTDWVLGSGLTLAESYEENVTRPAYRLAAELQFAEVDNADE